MTPLHSPSSSRSFGTLIVQFQQEMTEINQSLHNWINPPLSSLKASLVNLPQNLFILELIGPHGRGLWPLIHNWTSKS